MVSSRGGSSSSGYISSCSSTYSNSGIINRRSG